MGKDNNIKLTPESLRLCRRALNLSQSRLSVQCGFSGGLIGLIERGEKRLTDRVERRVREEMALTDEQINDIMDIHYKLQK